jgi:prepilin-type N-terminal cleavage/methylation domain-containing protein
MKRKRASTRPALTRGFTLFELLVALGVSSLLFAAIASMMLFSGRSTASLGNYADMARDSRNATDVMSTDIRQANRVTACSSTQLQLEMVDFSSGATNALTYTYDPSAGTLMRSLAGATSTLVSGIVTNSFQFSMFQRNPVGGAIDVYTTLDPTNCKVVQMTWVTSRSALGLVDTESILSAKVVIRKQ